MPLTKKAPEQQGFTLMEARITAISAALSAAGIPLFSAQPVRDGGHGQRAQR